MNVKKLYAFALVAFLVMTSQTACQTNDLISDPFTEEGTTDDAGTVETSITVTEPEESEEAEEAEVEVKTEEPVVEPAATTTTPPATSPSSAMPEGKDQATDEINSAEVIVIKEFSLRAKQWEFIPSEIRVNKGDQVVLTITSEDVEHGFSLPIYNITETLVPGVPVTVKFTATEEGSFSFSCNIFCGSGHGEMAGTLIVE